MSLRGQPLQRGRWWIGDSRRSPIGPISSRTASVWAATGKIASDSWIWDRIRGQWFQSGHNPGFLDDAIDRKSGSTWWWIDGSRRAPLGPIDEETAKEWIDSGAITSTTKVWSSTEAGWVSAETDSKLKGYFIPDANRTDRKSGFTLSWFMHLMTFIFLVIPGGLFCLFVLLALIGSTMDSGSRSNIARDRVRENNRAVQVGLAEARMNDFKQRRDGAVTEDQYNQYDQMYRGEQAMRNAYRNAR